MTIWIDAQISPAIAPWIRQNYSVDAVALREIGLRDAEDEDIFHAAKSANAVVMTKDSDFLLLLDRFGTPPQILWVTCDNTSNTRLKEILSQTLSNAIALVSAGEQLVEIKES